MFGSTVGYADYLSLNCGGRPAMRLSTSQSLERVTGSIIADSLQFVAPLLVADLASRLPANSPALFADILEDPAQLAPQGIFNEF